MSEDRVRTEGEIGLGIAIEIFVEISFFAQRRTKIVIA